MSEPFATRKKISPILLAILLVALLLSVASIFQGVDMMFRTQNFDEGSFYLTLGATTLALSTYVLFQTRKRIWKLALKTQPITTTILCEKCGLKNVRDFQRGDYIFKEVEPCPKCNENMVITSIYRVVNEKSKREPRLG
jgi:ssDNA-binding Zn-finger/Zn-ribbon topoisomerase 1